MLKALGREPRSRTSAKKTNSKAWKPGLICCNCRSGATFRDVCHEHEFEGSKASIDVLKPPEARILVRAVGEEIIIEGSEAWIDMLKPPGRKP